MSFLFRRFLNRLQPTSLEAAAVAVRIVSPAQDVGARPAVFLPGEFDAIIDVVNGDRELEWKRVSGAPRPHLATVEYVLANARLSGPYLAAGRYVQHYATQMPLQDGSGKSGALDAALLSTNSLSGLEFGHWVRDSLIAEMHGVNMDVPAIGMARGLWPHEPEFRQLSGLDCQYLPECRVDRLVILDDRGHNVYWQSRFLALRSRLRRSAAVLPGESAGPLIFLSRGAHGRVREPTNVTAVQSMLEGMGFRTVMPTALSPSEIGVALRDARIVVSAEGSHLNHVHFFAPDGAALVVLQDPRRFYAYHKGPVDFYDGLFGFVVGRPDPAQPERFAIDMDRLGRTLDMVDTTTSLART